ncbi:MAG: hypothetical protein QNL68_15470 [Akkermansiaceae bacterium]
MAIRIATSSSTPAAPTSPANASPRLGGAILRLRDLEAFESLNASFHCYSARPWAASKLPRH